MFVFCSLVYEYELSGHNKHISLLKSAGDSNSSGFYFEKLLSNSPRFIPYDLTLLRVRVCL